ncbi:MAG: glycosyltransferase [bacterium]|nr:glycosyltransferase [bacterium]
MRILIVHPFDPWGEKTGGIENLTRLLIAHAPDDVSISAAGVSEDPARPPERWHSLQYENTPVEFFPLLYENDPNLRKTIPLFLRFAFALWRTPIEMDDAVCLVHRVEPLAAARIVSTRNALCFHSDPREIISPSSEVKWKHLPWLYRAVEARAVRKAARLLCVNASTVDELARRYPSAPRATLLPTSYRNDVFHRASREKRQAQREHFAKEYGLDESARWIVFAARLERQKHPELALRTLAETARQEHVNMLVIGEGGLRRECERLARELGLKGSARFAGRLAPGALANAMRASDLFLMTSRFEGLPLAALEALACGLPVVSTSVGEMEHVIQPGVNGELAEANAEALANAALTVLRSPDRYPPEVCARSAAPYQPETVVQQWYDALRELA